MQTLACMFAYKYLPEFITYILPRCYILCSFAIIYVAKENMALPIPGKPVRGSKTGQPIMALLDLLGRSWSMGIVWHLYRGPSTFRKLQEYCESISPTTLNKRLKELKDSYLIERTLDGYALTRYGKELYELLAPLGGWAKIWAKNFK